MLYFFHHYELPLILRQVQLQNMLIRTANNSAAQAPNSPSATETTDATDGQNEAHGSEVDSTETRTETETIDRDSPEIPSDESEMESVGADDSILHPTSAVTPVVADIPSNTSDEAVEAADIRNPGEPPDE